MKCEMRFHTSCTNLDEKELQELESGNGSWYCTNCKADCGLSYKTNSSGQRCIFFLTYEFIFVLTAVCYEM